MPGFPDVTRCGLKRFDFLLLFSFSFADTHLRRISNLHSPFALAFLFSFIARFRGGRAPTVSRLCGSRRTTKDPNALGQWQNDLEASQKDPQAFLRPFLVGYDTRRSKYQQGFAGRLPSLFPACKSRSQQARRLSRPPPLLTRRRRSNKNIKRG